MNKKGVGLTSWIEKKGLEHQVLTEINRIWRPAQIEWAIEKIVEDHFSTEDSKSSEDALHQIMQSKRDDSGKSDPSRIPEIESFFTPQHLHPVVQNLHFFPYLGTTSQGHAINGGNIAHVGLWTDKPSGGNRPPKRTLLVEPLPFLIGSLGRTCAHELGHNLRLNHPSKDEQSELGRLMGGKQQGYTLTKEEIATARAAAIKRANTIQAWIKQDSSSLGK